MHYDSSNSVSALVSNLHGFTRFMTVVHDETLNGVLSTNRQRLEGELLLTIQLVLKQFCMIREYGLPYFIHSFNTHSLPTQTFSKTSHLNGFNYSIHHRYGNHHQYLHLKCRRRAGSSLGQKCLWKQSNLLLSNTQREKVHNNVQIEVAVSQPRKRQPRSIRHVPRKKPCLRAHCAVECLQVFCGERKSTLIQKSGC